MEAIKGSTVDMVWIDDPCTDTDAHTNAAKPQDEYPIPQRRDLFWALKAAIFTLTNASN